MTDRELMQQALDALEAALSDDQPYIERCKQTITALRAALENEFNPDWDAMAVMVEEQQRMATQIENLRWRLKAVNTAAMNLTHDLVCMDYDDDDCLNRDRVMGRIMQWRNEWDKAMFKERNT